jgi:copper chaperone NosL
MTNIIPSSRITIYYLLIVLLVTACAPKSNEPQPPEIIIGQTLCDSCGMIISEAKFAAATIMLNGEPHKFDDISEMIKYHMMDHPEAQVKVWFVHDYPSKEWMRGETAFFVLSPKLKTPMGGGVAAFRDQAAAKKFAIDLEGKVYNFDELRVELHRTLHN